MKHALALASVLVISLTACGEKKAEETSAAPAAVSAAVATSAAEATSAAAPVSAAAETK